MSGCTPVWVTILVGLLSLVGGHFLGHALTKQRERVKVQADSHAKWQERFRESLKAITDAAVLHYCGDPASTNTAVSCGVIMADLKRLSKMGYEAHFASATDSQYLSEALVDLNDRITGAPDFQNPNRTALKADDPVIIGITDAEAYLLEVLRRRCR